MNLTIDNQEYEEISYEDLMKNDYDAVITILKNNIHHYFKLVEKYPKVFKGDHYNLEVFETGNIQMIIIDNKPENVNWYQKRDLKALHSAVKLSMELIKKQEIKE